MAKKTTLRKIALWSGLVLLVGTSFQLAEWPETSSDWRIWLLVVAAGLGAIGLKTDKQKMLMCD